MTVSAFLPTRQDLMAEELERNRVGMVETDARLAGSASLLEGRAGAGALVKDVAGMNQAKILETISTSLALATRSTPAT